MRYFLVLTTVANAEQAGRLARHVVESRLAACASVQSGLRSVYRWEGEIQDEPECLLLLKTREDCLDALETAIHKEHPYDVPEFVVLPIERGSDGYLRWLDACVGRT